MGMTDRAEEGRTGRTRSCLDRGQTVAPGGRSVVGTVAVWPNQIT